VSDELNRIVDRLNNHQPVDINAAIDCCYSAITDILSAGAQRFVPQHKKNFYKYWWDQEMDLLKEELVNSDRIWKAAGKPRCGPLFDRRQSCRMNYRKRLREAEKSSYFLQQ